MRTRTHPNPTGRRARLTLGLAALGAIGTLVGLPLAAPAASADSSTTTTTSTPAAAAGITPLLQMFDFGDNVGLPLACSDAGSVISIIGTQTDSSSELSPLVVQLDTQCNQLSSQGNGSLQQAIAESGALALINPVVDPLIADLATGAGTVGNQYGSSLSPFGPTVAGLGGTVTFFEGT